MARSSAIQKQYNREEYVRKYANRREALREQSKDKTLEPGDRFKARRNLGKLPRKAVRDRLKNRCNITGRPRGYLRKFGISRVTFREMALKGLIPGVRKSSW